MTKSSEKIVDVLIEGGIEYVFGMPGGGTVPIWDALYGKQEKIKCILVRHEQTAACMADAYGRLTGKPAVLMGQGPFIASNGAFGILESHLYGSPMVVLTDTSDGGFSQHGNYQSGTGEYGSYDLINIMRSMSKFTTYAVTPEEAVHGVQLAIKHSITGRHGPACVVVRNSAASGDVDSTRPPRLYPTQGYLHQTILAPSGEDIKEACQILLAAKKPVILAGSGVHASKAYTELIKLAEMLSIPVTTNYRGKSAFPEVNSLSLGMMGTFGQKVANDYLSEADLILIAGCRLSSSDIMYESPKLIDPSRQKIIQIDIEPRNTGWVVPIEMSLVGDLKVVLLQMVSCLRDLSGGEFSGAKKRLKQIIADKKKAGFCEAPELESDTCPVLPQRIVREIEKTLDESALITLDAGNNRLWTSHFFKSKVAGSFLAPGGVAGMGWGPPAALAVKLLNPKRPVVSIVGDGGFAMVSHVLSTAMQYQLPVVFVIMNNSALGMVRDGQHGKIVASEFIETDFTQLARAYKCNGVKVTKPEEIGPALNKALKGSIPTVIDIITNRDEPYFKIATM
jgi:acetolactate synthase I/II/III large subunit